MHRAPTLLATAMLLLFGAPARAADNTIDCGKAGLPDEKAICADRTLLNEDARMAALYEAAMSRSGMGERGDLRDGQAAWLVQRHACKDDLACLGDAYKARIGRLQKVIDAAASVDPL